MTRPSVLVSAGEGSGDAMAAPVVQKLDADAFGLGGSALAQAGTELVVDLKSLTAMGVGSVLAKAPRIAHAANKLLSQAKARRPRAALLVGYSEFNAWLGQRLRAQGIRVLWYAPPQIWAWRAERGSRLRKSSDRMAVTLPFEEELWRGFGVDAHFVGHPALEREVDARRAIRERLGMTPSAEYLALLPGSRPHEVTRHLGAMLGAVDILRSERGALDARIVMAPSLDRKTERWLRDQAAARGVALLESPVPTLLPAFDVALAASGSVTLECAVAEVPPVIVHKSGPLTIALARRLVQVDSIGLPNIVLATRAFPELIQNALTEEALADEAGRVLDDHATFVERCREAKQRLLPANGKGHAHTPSERVCALIAPWLA
jgi:lipid-A-disaccharide synthase